MKNKTHASLTVAFLLMAIWLISACGFHLAPPLANTPANHQQITPTTRLVEENSGPTNTKTATPKRPLETQSPKSASPTSTEKVTATPIPIPEGDITLIGTIQYRQLSFELYPSDDAVEEFYFPVTEHGTSHIFTRLGEMFRLEFKLDGNYEIYLTDGSHCQSVQDESNPNNIGVVCNGEEGERTLVFVVEERDSQNAYFIKMDLFVSAEEFAKQPGVLPKNISINEYELEDLPTLEDDYGLITPIAGAERGKALSSSHPRKNYETELNGQILVAEFVSSTKRPCCVVKVTLNGERVFSTLIATLTPYGGPILGLWTYDDSYWFVEVTNEIIKDGQLLNEVNGYSESFGFQLMHGKPFYFFKRLGKFWVFYDGQEIPLGYDAVPHYNCCSRGLLNLKQYENMVGFFALRDDTWYYVEVGVFE